MLRQYAKTFTFILIAFVIFLGNFAVNLLSPSLQDAVDADPKIQRLLWGVIVFCLLSAIFLFVKEHNVPANGTANITDGLTNNEDDLENRRILLGKVQRVWIDHVLHKSLLNSARIVLNVEGKDSAVIRLCDLALRRAGHPDTPIQSGTSIIDIYRQEQGELLIMGEPGSGKTTLILEIAEFLLQEANRDQKLPIPVVFSLSEWRPTDKRLDDWLIAQLKQEYGTPESIGYRWIKNGDLLLLLDGLDEVELRCRAACVEAINYYRQHHQKVVRPMVVCCRTTDYDAVPDLRLNRAVVIQPLTNSQVLNHLNAGGRSLSGLRAVLADDPTLYEELFQTPLMLGVAIVAYHGLSAAALRRDLSPEERKHRLWDEYIEKGFQRKIEVPTRFDKSDSIVWLRNLAQYMKKTNRQKIRLEHLDVNALTYSWRRIISEWFPPILFSIYIMQFMYIENLIFSLIFTAYLSYYLNDFTNFSFIPTDPLPYYKNVSKFKIIRLCLKSAFDSGAIIFAIHYLTSKKLPLFIYILCPSASAIYTAYTIFSKALYQEDDPRPDEGIRNLMNTFFLMILAASILCTINFLFFNGVNLILEWSARIFALAAFYRQGIALGQYYLARIFLWQSNELPLDITSFLDWAATRGLVRRTGGGWQFIHRTLQERFAEL